MARADVHDAHQHGGARRARCDDPSLVIVDVRHDLAQPDAGAKSQYRLGHIPGARFAHLDRDLSAPKTGTQRPASAARRRSLRRASSAASASTPTKQVVAYDQGTGMYAARLWWMLRSLGHEAVAVLDGGFAAWTREGRPVTTEMSGMFARRASSRAAFRAIVDAPPLRRVSRRVRSLLIDARAPRALSRRRRAARSRRRAHSRRDQSAVSRQPRRGRPLQARRRSRDGVRRAPRRACAATTSSTTAGPASPRVTTCSR